MSCFCESLFDKGKCMAQLVAIYSCIQEVVRSNFVKVNHIHVTDKSET